MCRRLFLWWVLLVPEVSKADNQAEIKWTRVELLVQTCSCHLREDKREFILEPNKKDHGPRTQVPSW